MTNFEIALLVGLSVMPLMLVLDRRVNTHGVFRTMAYGLMSVGALVALNDGNHALLELGFVVKCFERVIFRLFFMRCRFFGRGCV